MKQITIKKIGQMGAGAPQPTEESIVKYGDKPNIIADTNAEVQALKTLLKGGSAQEKDKRAKNVDSGFWFAAYFQTREQKEAFFKKIGIKLEGGQYVNGFDLCKALGIDIKPEAIKKPEKFKSPFKQ